MLGQRPYIFLEKRKKGKVIVYECINNCITIKEDEKQKIFQIYPSPYSTSSTYSREEGIIIHILQVILEAFVSFLIPKLNEHLKITHRWADQSLLNERWDKVFPKKVLGYTIFNSKHIFKHVIQPNPKYSWHE